MRGAKLIFLLPIAVFLFSAKAFPQNPLEGVDLTTGFYKAYPLAMGGAWRALAEGAASMTLNPAGISTNQMFGLGFDYYTSGFYDARIISGSFCDGKLLPVVYGFSYDRADLMIGGIGVDVNQLTFVTSKQFAGMVSSGASFKYIKINKPASTGGDFDHLTGDIGVVVKPIPQLYLSSVFQNIYSGRKYEEVPFLMGYGLALVLGEFAKLEVDSETNFSTKSDKNTNFYFGGEMVITPGVSLRGGYGLDRVSENPFFGLGFGFRGPKMNLDFTFSERLDPIEQTYALSLQMLI